MFRLLKFLLFTLLAVVLGVAIGTVPIGGRTLAERIMSVYKGTVPKSTNVRPGTPAHRVGGATSISAGLATVNTAGAANMPEGQTENDRAAINRIIAARAKAR